MEGRLVIGSCPSEGLAGVEQQLLDDGPQRQRREEGQRADDARRCRSTGRRRVAPWVGKVPRLAGTRCLAASEPAIARTGTMIQKRPTIMATAPTAVVEDVVRAIAGEGASRCCCPRREGVQDLAEAVGPAFRPPAVLPEPGRRWRCRRGQHEWAGRGGRSTAIFISNGLDLLAQVLGRAADHQAGDEDRQDDEDQHPVQARADAAEDHLAVAAY